LVGLSVFHALFPDVIIDNLEYSHYKEWIDDKSSFNQIINLVKNQ